MGKNLMYLGWFGFAVAAMYYGYSTQTGTTEAAAYIRNTRDIAIVAAAMVLGGYVLSRLGKTLNVGKGRCKTCGKPIPKSEIYCYNHGLKQIWDAQDNTRDRMGGR